MTKIGFTGTQHGMTSPQKKALRELLDGGAGEFHHGDPSESGLLIETKRRFRRAMPRSVLLFG